MEVDRPVPLIPVPPSGKDAFICYRRSDGQAGAWYLKEWLSRYRLPKGFDPSRAARVPSKAKPLEVFVDKDSEGTTDDYWSEHVRPALDAAARIIVLWTPAASRRYEGWDPMWAEIDHVLQAGRAKDIILVRLGVEPGSPSPGNIVEKYPRMEYRTPFASLLRGPAWSFGWRVDKQELARIAAGVCGVSSSVIPLLLGLDANRERARLRARVTLGVAVAALLATALSFWLLGFRPRLYAHYKALSREMSARASHEPPSGASLSELAGEYYAEFWVQSFERGTVVHPTQLEQAFGRASLPDHTRSVFIMLRGSSTTPSRWFFQRRPPVPEPPRDREEFSVWLEAMPKRDGALVEDGWSSSDGQTASAIAKMYSTHGGTVSISGGIAIAYASYRLDRYLGAPTSPEKACSGIFRIHRGGYRLLIAGPPDQPGTSRGELMSLTTDRSRETPESAESVGHSYAWGRWSSATIETGAIESRLRPAMPQRLSLVSPR